MFLQSALVGAAVILLAVILDVWLIRWSHQKWRVDETGPQVWVLGRYSPVLTWLKYRRWPAVRWRLPFSRRGSNVAGKHIPSPVSDSPFASAPVPPEAPPPEDLPSAASSLSVSETTPESGPDSEPFRPTSRVKILLELPEGVRMRITVESLNEPAPDGRAALAGPAQVEVLVKTPAGQNARIVTRQEDVLSANAPTWGGAQHILRGWAARAPLAASWRRLRAVARSHVWTLEGVLFGLSSLVYLATRLIGLDSFPIYFFSDEAVQTVLAAHFIRDRFVNYAGEFFPTYFQNGPFYNLSASVYLQVIPYLLFGPSIFVTRATSVLVTALGALAVGLILKQIFKLPYSWAGVLLLSLGPAWFLHSRTAFETAEMVAFYAIFLYFYLLYRCRSPRYLYPALVVGAVAFYTYSPGQMVMLVTGALLFLFDVRYHWHALRRGLALRGVLLLAVLAMPYVRFRLAHPEAATNQLRERGSYLVDPAVPLQEKLSRAASEYAYGLSPRYWFAPNNRDLPRHVMKGYGNLMGWTLPFAALGLLLALKEIRSPAHRGVLAALLAAPSGALLVQVGITRVLMFVIPATLLTALGLSATLTWLERFRVPRPALAVGAFVLLSGGNFFLLRDALVNGPLWFRDYTLGGMQYGAKQLFGEAIPQYLDRDPNLRVAVSPSWANGADEFAFFFLTDEQLKRVQTHNIDYYAFEKHDDLIANTVLVMMPQEYEQARADPKFTDLRVEQTIPYPDGSPGFYFVRVAYSTDADTIFAAEREARRRLVEEQVELDGQRVTVVHSPFGAGDIHHIVDGDPFTLVRGLEANPLVLDFRLPQARALSGVMVTLGSMDNFSLTINLYAPGAETPVVYTENYRRLPDDPQVEMSFDHGPGSVIRIEIDILNNLAGETAEIHIREVRFH